MITIKLGDLLKEASNYDAIMHGCNCFHGEDSGVAAQVWQKYPMARQISREHHDAGAFDAYGSYSSVYGEGFTIINAYTQYHGGPFFDINAFNNILKQVNEDFAGCSIAIPLIGSGIGGGDWLEIQEAILVNSPDINWIVIVLEEL